LGAFSLVKPNKHIIFKGLDLIGSDFSANSVSSLNINHLKPSKMEHIINNEEKANLEFNNGFDLQQNIEKSSEYAPKNDSKSCIIGKRNYPN